MIKIENVEVFGFEHAIRGMRNPMNSWAKSDSDTCENLHGYMPDGSSIDCDCEDPMFGPYSDCERYIIGPNDHKLMMHLANGGPVHAKYRRMIVVYLDITAPLYWWKEFDTYKVGTVANSCSTMHKIHDKEFTLEDFSCEHLNEVPMVLLKQTIKMLNEYRDGFINGVDEFNEDTGERIIIDPHDKNIWWQMIQLLPSSYNQKRTIKLNYEVLFDMYKWRKNHKLDEWRDFCKWIESLPYSEVITGESRDVDEENGNGGETDDG